MAGAAELVCLSQPAFSRSIQAIERDVGMRLFDRETGAVQPKRCGSIRRVRGKVRAIEALVAAAHLPPVERPFKS